MRRHRSGPKSAIERSARQRNTAVRWWLFADKKTSSDWRAVELLCYGAAQVTATIEAERDWLALAQIARCRAVMVGAHAQLDLIACYRAARAGTHGA